MILVRAPDARHGAWDLKFVLMSFAFALPLFFLAIALFLSSGIRMCISRHWIVKWVKF